jgi:hypothetical protein
MGRLTAASPVAAGVVPGKPTMLNPNADMRIALNNLLEDVIKTSLVSS